MCGDGGALQGKGQMVAILQAVENMLRAGYTPERTVYLAFGHDCLSGGKMGACRTAAYLKKANVRLEVVLDEGDWIAGDYFPRHDRFGGYDRRDGTRGTSALISPRRTRGAATTNWIFWRMPYLICPITRCRLR